MAAAFQRISYQKLIIVYGLWCTSWVILQAYATTYTFGFDWRLTLTDAAITNILIAASGYVMVSMMRFYRPNQAVRLGLSVGLALLCIFAMNQLVPATLTEQQE